MTKQEIYKSEQSNDKDIVLYPEGKFYKAYERSAWRLCMLVHEFKVSCRWVGTAGAYIVSVGFPLESLDKWMSGRVCSYLPNGSVVASCAVDSNVDFPQIVIEKGATKRGTQR